MFYSQFRGVWVPGKDIARGSGAEGEGGREREGSFAIVGHHKHRVHGCRIVRVCGCWRRSIVGRHGFDLGSRSSRFDMADLVLILWVGSLFGWNL